MRGVAIHYTARELAWIKRHCHEPRRQSFEKFCRLFGRRDVTITAIKALCLRRRWMTGRTGCFPKGSIPFNKGKKMPYNAASARTQFKKGGVPPNRKWIGHERLNSDGYVEIWIAERNPHTGHARRYVPKHRLLWERLHGPVPSGHCLKRLDNNPWNTDPSNWALIPRALLPYLNGRWGIMKYDDAPSELRPTILAMAKLRHARFSKAKRKRGAS